MSEDSSTLISMGVMFMLAAIFLAHAINIYRITWIHESGLFIMIGLFGGSVWLLWGNPKVTEYSFSSEVFFDVILPPIIFSAAYNLKRKQFLNNFTPIMMLAIVGALMNFLMMSIIGVSINKSGWIKDQEGENFNMEDSEVMLFASLMSATDGVAVVSLIDSVAYPTIFGTLIGEGCINDAVAIILYESIDSLSGGDTQFGFTAGDLLNMFWKVCEIAAASIAIGVASGIASALYFKHVRSTPSPKVELTIIFLFGYLAYNICEISGMSAIIGVFFCGVTMSHYTFHSLSHEAQEASCEAFEALSYAGETFIYISLGFYLFSYTNSGNWAWGFLFIMLATLVIGRVFLVFICIGIINLCCRRPGKRISFKDQVTFWWGGLVRGSICFALSLKKETPNAQVIVTTTFFTVIMTTLTIGSLTDMFLNIIGVKDSGDDDEEPEDMVPVKKTTDVLQEHGRIRHWVNVIDENYIKKWLGGRARKLHELSADDPTFEMSYHKHYSTNNLIGVGPVGTSTYGQDYNRMVASSGIAQPPPMHLPPENESDQTMELIGNFSTPDDMPPPYVGSTPGHAYLPLTATRASQQRDTRAISTDDTTTIATSQGYGSVDERE